MVDGSGPYSTDKIGHMTSTLLLKIIHMLANF